MRCSLLDALVAFVGAHFLAVLLKIRMLGREELLILLASSLALVLIDLNLQLIYEDLLLLGVVSFLQVLDLGLVHFA